MSIESRCQQYGTIFHHWQIRDFLGSGSGGKTAVFRLVHTDTDTVRSALKIVNLIESRGSYSSLSESRKIAYIQAKEQCRKSAQQEVLLMNGLQGRTNIVDYLDHTFVDWEDAGSFGCDMLIRMELLHDLRSEILEDRAFSREEVIKIGKDICNALILCHNKNIIHRDIKPENIFFNEDGNYKLGDFGISRILDVTPLAVASTGIGTPQYLAPEQTSGKYDKRVDIYSLGLVLYELLNGNKLPFASTDFVTEQDVQKRMIGTPLPEPVNADKALAKVILKACAFKSKDRFQTAEQFYEALDDACKAMPPRASKKSVVARSAYHTAKAVGPKDNKKDVVPVDGYQTEATPLDVQQDYATIKAAQYQTEPVANEPLGKKNGSVSPMLKKAFLAVVGLVLLVLILILCISSCDPKRPSEPDSASSIASTGTQEGTEGSTDTIPNSETTGETVDNSESETKPHNNNSADSETKNDTPPTTTGETKQEVVLSAISVSSPPSKTKYYVGDNLSTSGLSITLTYSDGSNKNATSGYTCSPTTLNTIGKQTITVHYNGKQTTFTVQVEESWSSWTTKLPAGVDKSTFEIQEKTQYAAAKITKWHTLSDGMVGLPFNAIYDRTEFQTDTYDSGWYAGAMFHPGKPRFCYDYQAETQEATQYRYSDDGGAWSEWQFDAVQESSSRKVETRTVYRDIAVTTYSTRYYYIVEDGAWKESDYQDKPIEKDEDTAVKTRTVYRYRKKLS